jgi:hypothetical protein
MKSCKTLKRRERSLAFFAEKKSGKYNRDRRRNQQQQQQQQQQTTDDEPQNRCIVQRRPLFSHSTTRRSGDDSENSYANCHVNIIISDVSLILSDQFLNAFPSARTFIENLKSLFKNSCIVLYVSNINKSFLQSMDFLDLCVQTENKNIAAASAAAAASTASKATTTLDNERPLLHLRKRLFAERGATSLAGPYVLLTKSMNANNNKQYDIVKDVRRYYVLDGHTVRDVDYARLLNDIRDSIRLFFSIK